MSRAYKNRRKVIKSLRKLYQTEDVSTVKFYAVEFNDRWDGVAARLALQDRRISLT